MRLKFGAQRFGVPSLPLRMLLEQPRRTVIGMAIKCIDKIAVKVGVVGALRHRTAKALDCIIQASLLAAQVTEIDHRLCMIWLYRKRALQARDRLVKPL